jgi:(p)ppGpp synthase/HD superfamily hydrolase
MQTPGIEDALALAALAHKGQFDKAGQPYIFHPIRLMLSVSDQPARIVALLHDVVEDTPVTMDQLRALGYDEEILTALDCVTRRETETYEEFIDRLTPNPLARRVKLADLKDNMDMTRLPNPGPKDLARLERYKAAWEKLDGPPL